MAKAPKASTRKKPAGSKAADTAKEKIEDAVVIEDVASEVPDPAIEGEAVPDSASPKEPEQAVAEEEDSPVPDESTPEEPSASRAADPKSRAGGAFLGVLLGGVAAVAIGFVAARYVVPDGWPFPGVAPKEDPVAAAVEAQGAEIAMLAGKIEGLSGAVTALEADTALDRLRADFSARLDGLDATLSTTSGRLSEIDTRLAAVEKLAPEGSAAAQTAAEAYDRELTALRQMFEGELAKVEAAQTDAAELEAQAAKAAKAAAGRAALARVMAALDTGQPFDDALFDLTNSTGIEVPASLAGTAADGVPTLTALREAFPSAARAALDASVRAGVENGDVSRFTAFLQTQLGTRSLEAKEGNDADAVLSRAEAALRQGDIGTALTELDALPEAGQPAMADWRAMAEHRKAALDAGAALATDLNAK